MEIIDAAANPNNIPSFEKYLDKVDLNSFCDIEKQCLMTLLECQNIKKQTDRIHKINFIGPGYRAKKQNTKLNKETNNYTLMPN